MAAPAAADARVAVTRSSTPGGGEGLVASCHIDRGEVLLRELPLARFRADAYFQQDTDLLAGALSEIAASGELTALVESDIGKALWRGPSDDPRRDAFRRCIDDTWPEGSEEDRAARADAMNVLSYNAYVSPGGGRFQLVFPTISKANHACRPNVDVLAQEEGEGELVSIKPIAEGVEVLVSYLAKPDLLLPKPHRLSLLDNGWEFACSCARCAAPSDDVRRFACARPGCGGSCYALDGEPSGDAAAATACEVCGEIPHEDAVLRWLEVEKEVEGLIGGLPASLYSAWAVCDDFARAHPLHGLSGRWAYFLTGHTEIEAKGADSAEEAKELLAEMEQHKGAWQRCVDAVLQEPARPATGVT